MKTYDINEYLSAVLAFLDGDEAALDNFPEAEFIHPVHGRIVERTWEGMVDVTVYEDGYTDREYQP